jgi:uncharacterized protein YbjT (DUF2867 family)
MKIVVAGGTGFLGRHIARALMDAGHEVSVLGRSPSKVAAIPMLEGAGAIKGDVTEPSSLTGALEGFEAVVNAAQFPNHPVEVPRRGLTYDRYDRKGTENLLVEAKRAGVQRFAYISGAGADVTSDKTWYRAKGFAEAAIRESGLEWTVFRPSWAYGPEDKALNKFVQMARFLPVIPRLGIAPQKVQPVHVDDIAAAVAKGFEVWRSGRTYEVGGPDVMTMHEIIETLLETMGVKRLILPIPLPLAKLGTAPLVVLPSPPMTPAGIDFAVQDGIVDTHLLHEELGVHPVGLAEGLARYIKKR